MTATMENSAPFGFQHLLQPHTWLNAVLPCRVTVTGWELHRQVSVPPAKSLLPGCTPLSTAGWILVAMSVPSLISDWSVGFGQKVTTERIDSPRCIRSK